MNLLQSKNKKVIAIVGPTATGKSNLAVCLAEQLNFGAEIISADSRQVYNGLDIGSGKITEQEMRGVPHRLLSVANVEQVFSVAEYKEKADIALEDILNRQRVPIVVGGTGFYLDALLRGQEFPEVPANLELRAELSEKTATELMTILETKDLDRAANIDSRNKVRIIRALEIVAALGKVPPLSLSSATKNIPKYDILWIGLDLPDQELKDRIVKRTKERLAAGMVAELDLLHNQGISWQRLVELGFDQKFIVDYLHQRIDLAQLEALIIQENWRYVKRQRTWFKRYKDIQWLLPIEQEKILHSVQDFLK